MFDLNTLKGLSSDEYKSIRAAIATFSKEVKETSKISASIEKEKAIETAENAVRAAITAGDLKVGSILTFVLKGETRTSPIVKVGEKTFTVQLDEGVRYIRFASVVLSADAPETV